MSFASTHFDVSAKMLSRSILALIAAATKFLITYVAVLRVNSVELQDVYFAVATVPIVLVAVISLGLQNTFLARLSEILIAKKPSSAPYDLARYSIITGGIGWILIASFGNLVGAMYVPGLEQFSDVTVPLVQCFALVVFLDVIAAAFSVWAVASSCIRTYDSAQVAANIIILGAYATIADTVTVSGIGFALVARSLLALLFLFILFRSAFCAAKPENKPETVGINRLRKRETLSGMLTPLITISMPALDRALLDSMPPGTLSAFAVATAIISTASALMTRVLAGPVLPMIAGDFYSRSFGTVVGKVFRTSLLISISYALFVLSPLGTDLLPQMALALKIPHHNIERAVIFSVWMTPALVFGPVGTLYVNRFYGRELRTEVLMISVVTSVVMLYLKSLVLGQGTIVGFLLMVGLFGAANLAFMQLLLGGRKLNNSTEEMK